MPSMIETLVNTALTRPDSKRFLPSRRPLPSRPRDLFELFIALGPRTSVQAIIKSCDLRAADARHLTFVVLNRWPTAEELAAQPAEYALLPHLRALLNGAEFRANLARRVCDYYPERPRLLYVQIPRCAGGHFLAMANAAHAIFPLELQTARSGEPNFVPALGAYLGRFNMTRTILIAQPRLRSFTEPPAPPMAQDALNWSINPPPRRPGDRLFTIVREPRSLVLSQVNAILTALRAPPGADTRATAEWRARLGRMPQESDAAGWKALGLEVMRARPLTNPICRALGDGTAATALTAARVNDLEIADLSLYADWAKYTWDVDPEPPSNISEHVLEPQDLTTGDAGTLDSMVAEDLVFYAWVKAALADLGLKTAIRGRDLT